MNRNLFLTLAAQDRNPRSKFESTATKCWLNVENTLEICGTRPAGTSLYKAEIRPVLPEKSVEINSVSAEASLHQLYHER